MPKIKFDAVLGHERYFEDVDFDNKNVLPSDQLALDFSKSNFLCICLSNRVSGTGDTIKISVQNLKPGKIGVVFLMAVSPELYSIEFDEWNGGSAGSRKISFDHTGAVIRLYCLNTGSVTQICGKLLNPLTGE